MSRRSRGRLQRLGWGHSAVAEQGIEIANSEIGRTKLSFDQVGVRRYRFAEDVVLHSEKCDRTLM